MEADVDGRFGEPPLPLRYDNRFCHSTRQSVDKSLNLSCNQRVRIAAVALIATFLGTIELLRAIEPGRFDGEYVDKKFLNGQAVFEFSVHQSGNALDHLNTEAVGER